MSHENHVIQGQILLKFESVFIQLIESHLQRVFSEYCTKPISWRATHGNPLCAWAEGYLCIWKKKLCFAPGLRMLRIWTKLCLFLGLHKCFYTKKKLCLLPRLKSYMKKIPHRLSLYLSKIVLCTQMDNGLPLNKVMLSTRVEELDEENIMMNILWGSSCTWIEVFSHLSLRVT